jgi:hypothetical protein
MADDASHDAAAAAAKAAETVKEAAAEAVADAKEAVKEAKEAVASTSSSYKDWLPSKEGLKRGMCDFKNVFLYPLCTGLMTGIGFVAGKRVAERYFYGPSCKVAAQ